MQQTYSHYYNEEAISELVDSGKHRDIIGGLWETMGPLQLDVLKKQGLSPDERFLDIGCGSLRGGIHFVGYLKENNYFGTDLNQSLIDSGYDVEISKLGLQEKLPRTNLRVDQSFDFDQFNQTFDRALAFSVFTHLPMNTIRVCLEKLARVMRAGGTFHATFFEFPEGQPSHVDVPQEPADIVTHGDSDPYHYTVSDFRHLVADLPWRVDYVGDIGHPRGQRLLNFVRLEDGDAEASETRKLSVEDSANLGPGADHYRAYVGPPERFDFMSITQIALLYQMGLRDHHRVLDFGCGSLRLGRLLIPFLQKRRYFGIDPNKWLIDEGIRNELGRDAVRIKEPVFDYNSDYDCTVFGETFEFIIAQSIVTHTGPSFTNALFKSVAPALKDDGIFLFSYIRDANEDAALPEDGWYYPECIAYSDSRLSSMLGEYGLVSKPIPWFHPGASWFAAARNQSALPADDQLSLINGRVVR